VNVYGLAPKTPEPWVSVVMSSDGPYHGVVRAQAEKVARAARLPAERVFSRYAHVAGRSRAYIRIYRGEGTASEKRLYEKVLQLAVRAARADLKRRRLK
jgi:hypothetical protein